MPAPFKFRTGWENENLAGYILSRFSFTSQPSTVSDDIGVDFFCTLYKLQKAEDYEYAEPKNSFAIQIKSNKNNINVSNKISCLGKLEIPYFVGIVDQSEKIFEFYSGEYLPHLFVLKGDTIKDLRLSLCNREDINNGIHGHFYKENGEDEYTLFLPKILDIPFNADRQRLEDVTNILSEYCSIVQGNIASKIGYEYIFDLIDPPEKVAIYSGPGSYTKFRVNFLKRLAEIFSNLKWIYENIPSEFDKNEFCLFEEMFIKLKDYGYQIPGFLESKYKKLKDALREG